MKTDVKTCARCGGEHLELAFLAFTQLPVHGEWTHFALCPANDEPILLKIVDAQETVQEAARRGFYGSAQRQEPKFG